MIDARPAPPARALSIAWAAGLGLLSGLGFVLPMLVMLHTGPGRGRELRLVLALLAAVLVIRRLGRVLHRMLDRTDQPWRFPLLALYGVAAMLPPITLLLLPAAMR